MWDNIKGDVYNHIIRYDSYGIEEVIQNTPIYAEI